MRRFFGLFLLPASAALLSSVTACSSETTWEDYNQCIARESKAPEVTAPASFTARVELVSTTDAALDQAMRDAAQASVDQRIDASKRSAIAVNRCARYKPKRSLGLFGAEEDSPSASAGSSSGGAMNAGKSPSDGASQTSGTNNQVAGVDEADFVKNDNKYIYVARGSSLQIVDAWPAAQAHTASTTQVSGTAKKLFVVGDRALVFSSVPRANDQQGAIQVGSGYGYAGGNGYGGAGECTYGYECVPTGDGTATVLSVYDVSNRAAPKLLKTVETSSSLLSARRVGNAVHTVLSQPGAVSVSVGWPAEIGSAEDSTEEEISAAFERLRAEAREKTAALKSPRPTFGGSLGAPAQSFYKSDLSDGDAFMSVLSVDMVGDGGAKVVTTFGKPGFVYASAGALYVAAPHQSGSYGWYASAPNDKEVSTVHKFAIGDAPGATSYQASGLVKGHVLNQFAMDEKDGFLRLATSVGHVPDPNTHSVVSVLEQKGGALTLAGEVDQIAPKEDIRAVRFDGDRGYVVTFKKTDPLFVFDLADPRHPKQAGELKIPGFSTYMHMMDATHLLTIGYDANDHDSFAYFDGVLLQIFDVSDPKNPTQTQRYKIGTRGSSSEALTNHLAFNYFAPKNVLAVPMTICEGGGDGTYGTNMTFSGLMVFDATIQGIQERGRVAHPKGSATCSNWWTDASSQVERSVIMDDFVYSISKSLMKVSSLTSPSTDVAQVTLTP